ncbi:hypothetical protein NDU88_004714 [Pleurodeles waltl]|uniref:Uncharacterized protein n=1 Tax=Pleurodeles waltl TaxID=8319 RepID=A0AAV7M740_PLEWA|nr:hypothetical protein NDU88_004714 [Pleurodeles waltl]
MNRLLSWIMKPGSDSPVGNRNLLMRNVKKCWTKYTYKKQQKYQYAPQLSLWALPGCANNRYKPTASGWEIAGIVEWGDIFEDHLLVPFDSLVNDYDIPPGTFLTYVALTRYAALYWGNIHKEPHTSVLMQT